MPGLLHNGRLTACPGLGGLPPFGILRIVFGELPLLRHHCECTAVECPLGVFCNRRVSLLPEVSAHLLRYVVSIPSHLYANGPLCPLSFLSLNWPFPSLLSTFPATSFRLPRFLSRASGRDLPCSVLSPSFSVPASSTYFIQVSPLFACGFVRCFSSSFFILPFILGTVVYVCWLWVSACLLALRPELCPVSCP